MLLFNFCHKNDALKGKSYWATPYGGLKHNDSFEQAALRELFEENRERSARPGQRRLTQRPGQGTPRLNDALTGSGDRSQIIGSF